MEKERVLRKEWTVNAFDRDKGEFVEATNRSYEHVKPLETWQATKADIRPSRKKSVERDYKTIVAFGDMQIDYRRVETEEGEKLIPIHDERAMKIARFICRDLNPDTIVSLGDNLDLASLSRFSPDSDHFSRTIGPSLQRIHDFYAELRADNPDSRIVEVDSNHNKRLKDYVLKHMPQMYGVRRPGEKEYPVMTYPYLANLSPLDIEFISGYGAAEFLEGENYDIPIAFRHGTETSSNGTTASKIMKNHPETHNVHGHSHKIETAYHTDRRGRYLGSFAVGALCKITGEVPSYGSAVDDQGEIVHHQENWQQSVMVINDYGNGEYDFRHVPINKGVARIGDREYRG